MKVRYDEGTANQIGPEPCVATREGRDEASVGDRAGQPWSRESLQALGADAVVPAEATERHALARLIHGSKSACNDAARSCEADMRAGCWLDRVLARVMGMRWRLRITGFGGALAPSPKASGNLYGLRRVGSCAA